MSVLFAILSCLDGDPPHAAVKAVEDKVRVILKKEFGELLTEKLAAVYVPKMAAPIARAAREEWRKLLLEELPSAAQYHFFSMRGVEGMSDELPGLPRFKMSPEDLAEGTEIELAYLVARVERAARRKLDPEGRKTIDAQIDGIWVEAVKAVAERLGGGGVPPKTKNAFDGLARAWKASFDMPYSTCLDRPLSEEQLGEVFAGMKAAASKTAVDEELLIPAVREAAYKAVGRCFSDYDPFQKKSDAWGAKRKKLYDDWLRANGVRVK